MSTQDSVISSLLKFSKLSHFFSSVLRSSLSWLWCFLSFFLRLFATSWQSREWWWLWRRNLVFILSASLNGHSQTHWLHLPLGSLSIKRLITKLLLLLLFSFLLNFHVSDKSFLFRRNNSVCLWVEFLTLLYEHLLANLGVLCVSYLIERSSTVSTLNQIRVLLRSVFRWLFIFRHWKVTFLYRNIIHGRVWIHIEIHFVCLWLHLLPLRSCFRRWKSFLRRFLHIKRFLVLSRILRSVLRGIRWFILEVWGPWSVLLLAW